MVLVDEDNTDLNLAGVVDQVVPERAIHLVQLNLKVLRAVELKEGALRQTTGVEDGLGDLFSWLGQGFNGDGLVVVVV